MLQNACKTLKPSFFWYAVDTNLFRLRYTNPKKKTRPGFYFFEYFFFKNVRMIFEQKKNVLNFFSSK